MQADLREGKRSWILLRACSRWDLCLCVKGFALFTKGHSLGWRQHPDRNLPGKPFLSWHLSLGIARRKWALKNNCLACKNIAGGINCLVVTNCQGAFCENQPHSGNENANIISMSPYINPLLNSQQKMQTTSFPACPHHNDPLTVSVLVTPVRNTVVTSHANNCLQQ